VKTLIIGLGEVGGALKEVLAPVYEVHTKDIEEQSIPDGIEIVHICYRYSYEFGKITRDYLDRFKPRLVNVCTTVPPGTTAKIGNHAVHSTTRGLHPHLATGLMNITKHIGGPMADEVATYFRKAKVPCLTHKKARTTEVAHLLNNMAYGLNLMYADEMARICRHYGVDYYEAVMKYTETNNSGFRKLDHDSKCRMVLTPPNGKIGGHCVVQSAKMLIESLGKPEVTPLSDMLAKYNDQSKV
jgi:hypothetical protein